LVWVILGYMLAQTALVLMVGRFADMIGRKKLYVGGFALFTAVSLIAGFSTGVGQLIVARVIMRATGGRRYHHQHTGPRLRSGVPSEGLASSKR
jgi:MFS family permease